MRCSPLMLIVTLLAGLDANHGSAQELQQWLEVGQQRISASLYQSRKAPARGGAVVLVAGGTSGAWPHSLHALGRYLPDDGWTTLRVDLQTAPAPTGPQASEQLVQQIAAAVEILRNQGEQRVVLVTAGGIAFQTLQAAKNPQIAGLNALVLFDLNVTAALPEGGLEFAALQMPILDLLSQHSAAETHALQRKLLAQQHRMANYRQLRAPAAGPNWNQRRDPVVQRIRGWLRKNG